MTYNMFDNTTEMYPEKWIWSHKDYPNFRFKLENFLDKINTLEKIEKTLTNLVFELSNENIIKIKIDILCDEIINTSIIEGEVLQRKSVRSSIRKKLDENFDAFADKHSTKKSDNLVAIFLDANSLQVDLGLERLFGWHNALFNGNSFNGLYK